MFIAWSQPRQTTQTGVLNVFRTNQLVFSFFLLFYGALLHVGAAFELAPAPSPPNGMLAAYLWPWLTAHDWLPPLLALVLLAIQGWLMNIYAFRNRLSPEVNLFPGVFLMLAGSAVPDFLNLTPYHFANLFLILALFNITATYKASSSADNIFNTGFWVGMAALFQADYLWMLLPFFVGLGILRARKIREQLILITGAFLPLLFAGFFYFWFDRWPDFIYGQFLKAYSWPHAVAWPADIEDFVALILLAALLLVVLFRYTRYSFKMVIDVQKKIDLLFWIMLAGGLAALTTPQISTVHWLIVVVPVGLLLGLLFTYMPRRTAEAAHLILWVLIMFLQLWPLAQG